MVSLRIWLRTVLKSLMNSTNIKRGMYTCSALRKNLGRLYIAMISFKEHLSPYGVWLYPYFLRLFVT